MAEQRTLLFALPEARPNPRMDPSDWRAAWVAAGVGPNTDWNQVRVVAVGHLLWVIAGSPRANDWIDSNLDAIAGTVADVCAGPARMEMAYRHVGVRAGQGRLWAYRIPAIVLEKGGGDHWKEHLEVALSPEMSCAVLRKIEDGVRRELQAWGALPLAIIPDKPFFVMLHPGRGMIAPGIHGDRSGHGKPVNVLLRKHVQLLSPLRIEGNVFAGALNSLGNGRLLRMQPPEMLEPSIQSELMNLPIFEDHVE